MTATEPNPTAEHIDAVARAMRQDPKSGGRNMSDVAREVYAERLLTSTDPAVHAAMLDALVRAGVLTVDLMTLSDGYAGRLVTEWGAADLGGNAPEVAP